MINDIDEIVNDKYPTRLIYLTNVNIWFTLVKLIWV